MFPVKPMGEPRWFEGSHYVRDRERGALTKSSKPLGVGLVRTFCVTSELSVPFRAGVRQEVW